MEQQVAELVAAMSQLQAQNAEMQAAVQTARQEAAAARASTNQSLIDTRLLGKPRSFDGSDEAWSNFSTILRAYMGAISPELLTAMQAAEAETSPIVQSALPAESAAKSTQLYFILVMLLEGRAQDKVPRVQHGAGLELWRLIAQEYEGKQPSRQAGMLQSILSYSFDINALSASLEKWERMVKQWETSTGKTLGRCPIPMALRWPAVPG